MIRAILFDFDGVLTVDKTGSHSVADFLHRKTGLGFELLRRAYGKYNARMLYGEITHRDMWPDFCADVGTALDPGLTEEAFRATPMNEEMLALVRELKEHYLIGMVTDNPAERVKIAADHFGLRPLFDVISVSGQLHARKDQPLIFERTFEALGVRPEECIFIDNTAKNLTIPGQMGVKTILFDDEKRDVEGLRKAIREITA